VKEQGSGGRADNAPMAARWQGRASSVGQKRLALSSSANDQDIHGLRENAGCQGKQQKSKVVVFADNAKGLAHSFNGYLQRVFGFQHGSGKVKKFGVAELAEGAIPLCFLPFFIGLAS
jgi:hypothetical protein